MKAPLLTLALVLGAATPALASLESDVANAAGAGDYQMVKYLTESGANLNVRDEEGYTPLIWASQHGNTRVADYLIAHGANLNPLDKGGYTPLMWACQEGHFSTVALLLEKGANPWVRNWRGQTAMDLAALYGRDDRIREVLTKYGSRQQGTKPGMGVAFNPGALNPPIRNAATPYAGAPAGSTMAASRPPASGGNMPTGVNSLAGQPTAGTVNSLAGEPTAGAGQPNVTAPVLREPGMPAKGIALAKLAQSSVRATQQVQSFVQANTTNPFALLDPDLPLGKDIAFMYADFAKDQSLVHFKTSFDKVKTSWNNRQDSKFKALIQETDLILREAGLP